jgi:hypothetical protein
MEINKNKKTICGIKIKIPQYQDDTLQIKLVKTPAGNESFAKLLNERQKSAVNKSIGAFDQSKWIEK